MLASSETIKPSLSQGEIQPNEDVEKQPEKQSPFPPSAIKSPPSVINPANDLSKLKLSKFDMGEPVEAVAATAEQSPATFALPDTQAPAPAENESNREEAASSLESIARNVKREKKVLERELRDFLVEEAGNFIAETTGNYVSILTTVIVGTVLISKDCLFSLGNDVDVCSGGISRINFISRGIQVMLVRLLADVLLVYGGRSYGIPYHLARMRFTLLLVLTVAAMAASHVSMVVSAFRGVASRINKNFPACLPHPFPQW
ncbi:hypothetical protein HDU96_005405 [Phlyctochytrium bullatum]|nr:hypothetical protein HDU96_005405 [Phlyctochytrium bullatum]